MAIGTRQIVLMTHLATKWPNRVRMDTVDELVDPECDHSTAPVSRNRNGKVVTEKWRDCYCWVNIYSVEQIYDGLLKRGFIVKKWRRYQLTAEGWRILGISKKAPVKILASDSDGFPTDFKIRKSQLKEFQVLYVNGGEA